MIRMEMVIYMAAKAFGPVKPRTHADKHAASEPLWPVIAVRGAIVRRDVIVSVGTIRHRSNVNRDLGLGFGKA
jgi:hypothetical protein